MDALHWAPRVGSKAQHVGGWWQPGARGVSRVCCGAEGGGWSTCTQGGSGSRVRRAGRMKVGCGTVLHW
jgi:hypothetical protein